MPSSWARWDKWAQDTFAVALLVVVLALIGVFLALAEHGVDQARELVAKARSVSSARFAAGADYFR